MDTKVGHDTILKIKRASPFLSAVTVGSKGCMWDIVVSVRVVTAATWKFICTVWTFTPSVWVVTSVSVLF